MVHGENRGRSGGTSSPRSGAVSGADGIHPYAPPAHCTRAPAPAGGGAHACEARLHGAAATVIPEHLAYV